MNKTDIRALVRPNIRGIVPYSTARDDYKGSLGTFLDANESPYPSGFNRYPDPRQKVLKERLSQIKGLPTGNIFVGNGSDEAIDLVYRVFCIPGRDSAIILTPSYGMYSVCAEINDVAIKPLMLNPDFSLPEIADEAKLLFICSPNNPTANAFSRERLIGIVDSFNGIVVIDEAYADFSSRGSLRAEVLNHPNLIVLQTLSKAWGLAGLRLGLAFADEYIIRLMSEIKYPYNINLAAQQLAMKALESTPEEHIKEIIAQRDMLSAWFPQLGCVREVYPSDANFLLVSVDDADTLYGHLIADGIIVRNRSRVPLCNGCLRITVGLPEENQKLKQSLLEYEKGNIHRP